MRVRQRCIISPFFFLILIDWMMHERANEWRMQGLQWDMMENINKSLNGPHIVHLSTMCHLWFPSAVSEKKSKMSQPTKGRGGYILLFRKARKTQTLQRTLTSYFQSSLVELSSAVSEEKSKMSQPIRGRPGRSSCFSYRTEKYKLRRGHWDLASCKVSLNSVQRFQRRSRKCRSQSEVRAAILFYRSARKTQTWWRTLRSCFLSNFGELRSVVWEKKSKMPQPIKGLGGHLVFHIEPKNTNFAEDVEILLPVKFRLFPFSNFRGEVQNVSANQRPGWSSCFPD